MTLARVLYDEINKTPKPRYFIRDLLMYRGYSQYIGGSNALARGAAAYSLFAESGKYIYDNDYIAGSLYGLYTDEADELELSYARRVGDSYGRRSFWTNSDHFAPDYITMLSSGPSGIIEKIDTSMLALSENDSEYKMKSEFLQSARMAMSGFIEGIKGYAKAAQEKKLSSSDEESFKRFEQMERSLSNIAIKAPENFYEALQLLYLCHTAFAYEGRFAMAIGRLDQYLYPFYVKDIGNGTITKDYALTLLESTLIKIGEFRYYFGGDDTVNICIGGVDMEGNDATNDLSYLILEAVHRCNIPGPNLSARIHSKTSDEFLSACLDVIGTGLGYPALMNDGVNIRALARMGYDIKDCRNYCMVGCIENFIPGMQPPWSDGRFNVPKFLELTLNNGICMLTGNRLGPKTGKAENFDSMDQLIDAFVNQVKFAARDYVCIFNNENSRYNPNNYNSPFLSCFCRDCIARARDINNGGSVYKSAHGAGCIGIGTIADCLAAIEKVIFTDKEYTMAELCDALRANFNGYERLRAKLLHAPKYGNNDETADKYARFYVQLISGIFDNYRTPDGGRYYIAIASNIQNISAGAEVAATPDGRFAKEAVSDAASPTFGRDILGPSMAYSSLSKPDYTLVACGTVVNQKYSPSMFTDKSKKEKLLSIIRTYFDKGGQEMQINSVSRDILTDAMNNPEKYASLVVRVSGFSAFYTSLPKEVQQDILNRTEQG